MGKPRRITRTHCIEPDCGVKLTDENRYPSVRSRCKSCHIKKVKGVDQTKPPETPTCQRCARNGHYCRGCGTKVEHGREVCDACSMEVKADYMPSARDQLIQNYTKLGITEHLPAALAELDERIARFSSPPNNPSKSPL